MNKNNKKIRTRTRRTRKRRRRKRRRKKGGEKKNHHNWKKNLNISKMVVRRLIRIGVKGGK